MGFRGSKNQRRITLIYKRNRGSLTTEEQSELETLQAQLGEHLKVVAPRSTGILDEFADHIEKLKAKITLMKGSK